MHTTIIICVGLLGFMVFALGLNVSLTRKKANELHAAGDDPASPVMKAVRAHGNAAEYIGVVIGLFLLAGVMYSGRDLGLYMSALIIGLTGARVLQAIGMLTSKTLSEPNLLRFIGSLLTYLLGIVLSLTLIVNAFI